MERYVQESLELGERPNIRVKSTSGAQKGDDKNKNMEIDNSIKQSSAKKRHSRTPNTPQKNTIIHYFGKSSNLKRVRPLNGNDDPTTTADTASPMTDSDQAISSTGNMPSSPINSRQVEKRRRIEYNNKNNIDDNTEEGVDEPRLYSQASVGQYRPSSPSPIAAHVPSSPPVYSQSPRKSLNSTSNAINSDGSQSDLSGEDEEEEEEEEEEKEDNDPTPKPVKSTAKNNSTAATSSKTNLSNNNNLTSLKTPTSLTSVHSTENKATSSALAFAQSLRSSISRSRELANQKFSNQAQPQNNRTDKEQEQQEQQKQHQVKQNNMHHYKSPQQTLPDTPKSEISGLVLSDTGDDDDDDDLDNPEILILNDAKRLKQNNEILSISPTKSLRSKTSSPIKKSNNNFISDSSLPFTSTSGCDMDQEPPLTSISVPSPLKVKAQKRKQLAELEKEIDHASAFGPALGLLREDLKHNERDDQVNREHNWQAFWKIYEAPPEDSIEFIDKLEPMSRLPPQLDRFSPFIHLIYHCIKVGLNDPTSFPSILPTKPSIDASQVRFSVRLLFLIITHPKTSPALFERIMGSLMSLINLLPNTDTYSSNSPPHHEYDITAEDIQQTLLYAGARESCVKINNNNFSYRLPNFVVTMEQRRVLVSHLAPVIEKLAAKNIFKIDDIITLIVIFARLYIDQESIPVRPFIQKTFRALLCRISPRNGYARRKLVDMFVGITKDASMRLKNRLVRSLPFGTYNSNLIIRWIATATVCDVSNVKQSSFLESPSPSLFTKTITTKSDTSPFIIKDGNVNDVDLYYAVDNICIAVSGILSDILSKKNACDTQVIESSESEDDSSLLIIEDKDGDIVDNITNLPPTMAGKKRSRSFDQMDEDYDYMTPEQQAMEKMCKDIVKLSNVLRVFDLKLRTDIRHGNPERSLTKNAILRLWHSLEYQVKASGWNPDRFQSSKMPLYS